MSVSVCLYVCLSTSNVNLPVSVSLGNGKTDESVDVPYSSMYLLCTCKEDCNSKWTCIIIIMLYTGVNTNGCLECITLASMPVAECGMVNGGHGKSYCIMELLLYESY